MDWAHETLYSDIKIGLKGNLIDKKKTTYQNLKIYDTPRFGKVLFLDNTIQTTEMDEFIYHEMLTHPLLIAHPNPKNVLVIGAGDGGVLREILKHKINKVTIVEIDNEVITLSQKHLPSLSKGAFNSKKVKIVIDDGAKFVEKTSEKFDIVIIDSPDPIGVARILFSKKFYTNIFSVLRSNGIMIRQTGSTMFQPDEIKENYQILKTVFPCVYAQIVAIPTYVGGFFSFLIASKTKRPQKISYKEVTKKYNKLNLETKYYNPDIHFASRKLPNYIKKGLYNE
ncbi:MAG: polyamine aminopropyltransferase [Candidatus Omnitrophota bacterium]|nr:MAG: polyamine aminopropyltransferase [Candidatus Omnitrophota bacterium]